MARVKGTKGVVEPRVIEFKGNKKDVAAVIAALHEVAGEAEEHRFTGMMLVAVGHDGAFVITLAPTQTDAMAVLHEVEKEKMRLLAELIDEENEEGDDDEGEGD